MSKLIERSQAQVIGRPFAKNSWDEWEKQALATFGGGYREPYELAIFHHGIRTAFSMMSSEMPSLDLIRLWETEAENTDDLPF